MSKYNESPEIRSIQRSCYEFLCEFSPDVMSGKEEYAAFISPNDPTRLIELQKSTFDDTCFQMTQISQSGGHRPITDIDLCLMPFKDDGLIRVVDFYREGMRESQSIFRDEFTVDHDIEMQYAKGMADWFSDIKRTGFEMMKETEQDAISDIDKSCSVLFSKVEIWTDAGSECDFFVGGIPREFDDIEDADEFQDFLNLEAVTRDYRVRVSSYVYGNGETENADDKQLAEIKEKFEEDEEWMSELTPIEDSEFMFNWDEDEVFNLKGMEDL